MNESQESILAEFKAYIRSKGLPIESFDLDSEIYYDMGISGEDLYLLLLWICKRYGLDFDGLELAEYAPDEVAWIIPSIWRLLGVRRYKSLTVRKLIGAIQSGKFVE